MKETETVENTEEEREEEEKRDLVAAHSLLGLLLYMIFISAFEIYYGGGVLSEHCLSGHELGPINIVLVVNQQTFHWIEVSSSLSLTLTHFDAVHNLFFCFITLYQCILSIISSEPL